MISESFSLDNRKIENYNRQGFLLLKNFFSNHFIASLKNKIKDHLASPSDKYQSGFSRIKFDLFNDEAAIKSLMESAKFRNIVGTLTKRIMLYTQGIGFELKKNESKGFPWHIGTQSFGYQRAEDFACTIWTPLAAINTRKQNGGMAYVPKNIVSGDFIYRDIDPAVFDMLKVATEKQDNILLEKFIHLRDGPLNDPAMKEILDYFAIEDDFELGDALLFDKNVIHRSIMLEDGPLASRTAFAMRFVCAESRYDMKRANDLEIPRNYFNYTSPTNLHLALQIDDGTPIKDSLLFKHDLKTRLLRQKAR